MENICKEIIKKGLSITWSAQARVDAIDEKVLKIMKKAGCSELYFCVESGSERILRFLNKGFTREQIIKAFLLCHKIGIKPGIFLIVGVPGEKREDIQQTVNLIKIIHPYLLNFSYLTPFPNTVLYQKTKHLLKFRDYSLWDEMMMSPYHDDCFEIPPNEAHDIIYGTFKEMINKGLECSPLQFICEQ